MILLYVDSEAAPAPARAEPVDAWILGQLADAVAEITGALDAYDFAAAVKALYRFIWNDVCDWYLEAAKARLYGDDAAAKHDVSQTLLYVLRSTLRLAHPVLPHVSERIWGELGEEGVLARASWPDPSKARRDPEQEAEVEQAFDFVVKLRQLRAVAQLPPRAPLAVQGWPITAVASLVETLGSASAAPADRTGEWRAVDVIAVGDVPVTVLAPGGAEDVRPRFEQELAKAEAEIERARRKLADARFVERAPAQLVQEERDKLERFDREAAELRERLAALGA
jgi:valyl-tRNA synthetase